MPLLPQQPLLAPTGMDSTSDAGVLVTARAQLLRNVLCDQKGALRTSISLVNLLAADFPTPIDAVGYFYGPGEDDNKDRILFVSDGSLYAIYIPFGQEPVPSPPGTASLVPGVADPFDPGVKVRFVPFGPDLICLQADGAKPPYRYDGEALYPLGIAPPAAPTVTEVSPTTPPSNKLTTQPYHYRLTYFDSHHRESSLGFPDEIQYTSGRCGSIAVPAWPDPDTTDIQGAYLYEPVPANTNYYRIHTFPTGDTAPFEDNLKDIDVQAMIAWPYVANFEAFHPPKNASMGAVHKNRLWLNNMDDPDALQVSNEGSASQFSVSSVGSADLGGPFQIVTDDGDTVMGIAPFGSVLGIWKRRGFHIVFGDTMQDFIARNVHQRGTMATDSIARCDNAIFSHDLDGIYSYDFQSVFLAHLMSQEIDGLLDAYATRPEGPQLIADSVAAYMDNKYLFWVEDTFYVFDMRADPAGWVIWKGLPVRTT